MSKYKEIMDRKVAQIEANLSNPKEVVLFSANSVTMFAIGFHLPLMGMLTYLQDTTTAYLEIECQTSCDQIDRHVIKNRQQYDVFARDLLKITPRVGIDFIFHLSKSIYGTDDISLQFSVYFSNHEYDIVYDANGSNEQRFTKKYLSDIEPSEIYILRDKICDTIFGMVAFKIDKILEANN